MNFLTDTLAASLSGRRKSKESAPAPDQSVPHTPIDLPPAPEQTLFSPAIPEIPNPLDCIVSTPTITDDDKTTTLPVSMKTSLKRRFKAACIADGQSMSALIKIWIAAYLKQRGQFES